MDSSRKRFLIKFIPFLLLMGQSATAGVFDLSGSFSYHRSTFKDSSKQETRRWGASIGYYFLALSEVELAVQDISYQSYFLGIEESSFHDRIYSIDWVQSFLKLEAPFQPYLKLGVGQLDRKASGYSYRAMTAVLGAGIRLRLGKMFSIRAEGATYLTDGTYSSIQDNFSLHGGISLMF